MGFALKITPIKQTQTVLEVTDAAKKRRIGIYGGTFNPIHIGHLIIANTVLNELNLDEIWFMPDNIPPHKNKKVAIDPRHRLQMLQRAVFDNPRFKIETLELERGGVSYTFDTMMSLKMLCPQDEFYFIIGGDMVKDLPNWYRIDDLMKIVNFVGVRRLGIDVETKYPITWIDGPAFDFNSSMIRDRIYHHKSVRYLVPDAVLEYIKREGLYLE